MTNSGAGPALGAIAELWRYPVKSLQGESATQLLCTDRGVEFDRLWCVKGPDGKFGSGKTTRRFRRMPDLLTMASFIGDDGIARVRFPDGSVSRVDEEETAERVSEVVGEPVVLAKEADVSHLDDGPVHVLTTGSIEWLRRLLPDEAIDSRRFRPNVVIDTDLREEDLVGRALQVGRSTLRVQNTTVRCVMTTQPQADLGFAPAILRTLERENAMTLGVYASVEVPGLIKLSDPVLSVPLPTPTTGPSSPAYLKSSWSGRGGSAEP